MPTICCPACGREIQFPEYFYGTEVACPAPGCGHRVQLPNADGTMPVKGAPAGPPRPGPAAAYYLRKPHEPDLVVGPLPRERLRQMAAQGKLQRTDQLSADRRDWKSAADRDPGLFARGEDRTCPTCGAVHKGDGDLCAACAGQAGDEAAGTYGMAGAHSLQARALTNRLEARFAAPEPLVELAPAGGADAILGAGAGGWLGLWKTGQSRPIKTWDFEPAPDVRLAIAECGGRAVVAAGGAGHTRLYLADFEYRRLREVADLDGRVRALALDADGQYLGLVDDGPDVRLYRVEPWKRLDRFAVRGTRFALCVTRDLLAAGDDDGSIALYDLRAGKVVRELSAPRHEPACPQRPLRLAFSRTGRRLFAAAGATVAFPPEHVSGIDPKMAYLLGGIPGLIVNNNVPVIWEKFRNSRVADLQARLERQTALRVWEVDRGGLVADYRQVFEHHHTGLLDAFFWPWGSAAATVGEDGSVHAFDLTWGHLGRVYEVIDPGELRRAKATRPTGSLIRRVEFTHDGAHALVLVAGDRDVRMVPWPTPLGEQSALDSVELK